jgi:hypothetical protein
VEALDVNELVDEEKLEAFGEIIDLEEELELYEDPGYRFDAGVLEVTGD